MTRKANAKGAKSKAEKHAGQRKRAARAELVPGTQTLPLDMPILGEIERGSPESFRQLELARSRWEHGDWKELLNLSDSAVAADPERAKLALLQAVAQSHAGDMGKARHHARQALFWGCKREVAARVLLSAAQNSLARVSAALEEDATAHFEEAIRLVEPHADTALLGRTRRLRELARMGLLPDAAAALEAELAILRDTPAPASDRLQIFAGQINLLKDELTLAMSRGQLHAGARDDEPPGTLTAERLQQLSVSQLGQDLWVVEKTGAKKGGYFIEFGATNGILLSNTYLLEKYFGWTGICAEPNPAFYSQLVRNRDCTLSDACIGARTGDEVGFVLADEFGTIADYADKDRHEQRRAAFSREGKVLTLTTISLNDLLIAKGAPREIDYLSIDTEGSEYDILAAFPFSDWTIRLITVEHNFTPMRQQIYDLLTAQGYVRTEAKWDDWYELAAD